jgi:ribosomal protein L11 methylase PrmA
VNVDSRSARPPRHPGSFRDPGASVLEHEGRLLRGLDVPHAESYRRFVESGLASRLESSGRLVRSTPYDAGGGELLGGAWATVLEHERLPFISYPYEWPFVLLQRAALLHLDIQREALEAGFALSDATAYNIQFRGPNPIFIDVGSFRPYDEGELWAGHRQFCEQFLNPLLLAAEWGLSFQPWLRGSLEGIPTPALAAMLPARRWLSLRHVMHVLLPARAERSLSRREPQANQRIRKGSLPREAFALMLGQLRSWIASLRPRGERDTLWAGYAESRTYDTREIEAKRAFVERFARERQPRRLWDLGCNDGEFCEIALRAGAGAAIGFDADDGALARACERAIGGSLDLLPLHQDAMDPSPSRGWLGRERESLFGRGLPDAVMALAFLHHLALARNVPLDEAIGFVVDLAPQGIVEFVPKSDPTVVRMLALKGDLFPGYDEAAFADALQRRARIVRREVISASGRTLYAFER